MFKTYIFLLALIMIFVIKSHAQVTTGGNVGINYEGNNFIADIAPEIGYRMFDNALAGFSPFVLFHLNTVNQTSNFIFGARTFGEYKINEGIFAHVEYEISSSLSSEGMGKIVHSAPIGGGYETEVSNNSVAYIMVLYDVLYDIDLSNRTNPIIRAGVRYSF